MRSRQGHHKKDAVRAVHVGQTTVLSHGQRITRLFDPYHFILNLTWPRFFGLLVLMFVSLNLLFGTAYWSIPGSVANARHGVFMDYVFFSIETLATVGYGAMSPANLGGHIVASIEIMLGMAGVALTTGLIFARFAKPKARMMFSQHAIVRNFDGKRMLMLRIANERYNRIVDASALMSIVRLESGADGEAFFRIHDLKLTREHTQVFNLTWTLMHEIDEHSPLHQYDAQRLADTQTRIMVSVTGHDETVAASVYAVHNYEASQVMFDVRFADVLRVSPEGEQIVDLTRFHLLEDVGGARPA
jgi:inward rectifier potassium channel